ncbi:MAG: hypothetical protein CBB87_04765 [Micavibrio sp. TMED27]|nr:sigma-54-dependent Fis family transcriptional regulator [Micavibrio sp.]OUT91345.1 MAG: hypothetical protein CBB87_04765 [Micavibrio sp. TMED27]
MTKPVLIVEDDQMQRHMLATLLKRKLSFNAYEAQHGRKALEILEQDKEQTIKLIILDLNMPVMGGIETLEALQQKHPNIPVIMLTGSKNIEDAVEAMKLGAVDFIMKPYEAERMAISVKNALKISTLTKEVSRLKGEKNGTYTFENLIGYDKGLLSIVEIGRKASAADIPILITGETGTGKEVFARAIHGESVRKGKPFIAVNCGAIPSQLVESTLFGHEKGSFTGAIEKSLGKFREAEGGTIFLDEVGELPTDTQTKLLRVLQQKEVEPVGAGKPVPINVRLISATNRNIKQEVEKGHFREDLYFRLNVLEIELPPLKERKQDIPALTNHFIDRFCATQNTLPKEVSETTYKQLMEYNWPGNVRQLENTISKAMVMSEGHTLEISGITDENSAKNMHNIIDASQSKNHIDILSNEGVFKSIFEIEQEAIEIALEHFDNNITQAAKALGIAKSTFYKKIKSKT